MKEFIAAALTTIAAAGTLTVSAAPAGAAPAATAEKCGAPILKVWYDSDQTGSWANAWFEPDTGCAGHTIWIVGNIYCVEGSPRKRIYVANKTAKAPYDTPWVILPKTCKRFVADAIARPSTASDNWGWRYGYAP